MFNILQNPTVPIANDMSITYVIDRQTEKMISCFTDPT